MQSILSVHGLCKNYEGFQLQDVGLTLEGGTILGLIGENGAGKTTTIRAILGLIAVDRGEVEVFGMSYRRQGKNIRERIGVVLDDSFLSGELTARDLGRIAKNIYRRWDEPCFFRMLQSLQLPPDKSIKKYSSGMRAKLKMAAALPHGPDLLVLDEPTAGLDPVARNEILGILRTFAEDPEHAVLISSHITSDLEHIADRIVFIHQGRTILSNSTRGLIEDSSLEELMLRYGKSRQRGGVVA